MGLHEEEVKRLIRQQWKPDLDSIMEDGGKLASGYAAEMTTERDSLRAQLKASQADVKLLREALQEAACWLPDGTRTTPRDRGAKCETFSEAREIISIALTATAPKGEQG